MSSVLKLSSDPFFAGTAETVPCHIWMDEVFRAAVKHGAAAEHLHDREIRSKLLRSYGNREPMWMGVDVALQLSKAHSGRICGHCGALRWRP